MASISAAAGPVRRRDRDGANILPPTRIPLMRREPAEREQRNPDVRARVSRSASVPMPGGGNNSTSTQFKLGNPGGPGRPRGSSNRMKADLAQMILSAAEAGFLKTSNKSGLRTATGIDGCQGYLRWSAVNEPRTYLALMARILPYYVNTDPPAGKGILTHDETLALLHERGLPEDLIDHLRKAPEILDVDEDPDPYGLLKNVTP